MTTVDVWHLPIEPDARAERAAHELLTPEERLAVDRYRDPADRAARVRARALLRTVLARSCGGEPREIALVEADTGRLRLVDSPLRFSVSHSHTLAVVATCATHEIGIDVEPRRDLAWHEVADRFFAAAERAAIARRPPGERLDAFFATWVRKEAYLKGLGTGFTDVSDDFEVPLDDGAVRDPTRPAQGWYLHGLDLDPAHAAALAVAARGAGVVVHDARAV
jgi:4'-phosphopantetheinyl transferase